MQLLDLLYEILIRICETLGPSEFRTNVNYLLICKRLYNAGVQVYLSDLDISRLRLSAYDVERLPPSGSPLLKLIQEKVVHLSTRLEQRAYRQVAITPFIEGPDVPQLADESLTDPWTSNSEARSSVPRDKSISFFPAHCINPGLSGLVDLLTSSSSFRSFSLEAIADSECLGYILYPRTFAKILRSLPSGLRSVHLDLCGRNAVAYDEDYEHICPILGGRLRQFESVRLRLPYVCPELIRNSGSQGRLQKLIIRLNQPLLSDYSGGLGYYEAKLCSSRSNSKGMPRDIVLAGLAKGRSLAKDLFRISFRDPRGSGINVGLIDCIFNEYLVEPSDIFCYEEDGSEWDFWEEKDSLIPGRNFDWQTA